MFRHALPRTPRYGLTDKELFACNVLATKRVQEDEAEIVYYGVPFNHPSEAKVLRWRELFDQYYAEEIEAAAARKLIEQGLDTSTTP